MNENHWLAVAIGGALGAVLRHASNAAFVRLGWSPFVGTLCVNALGCLAIGWLLAWAERTGALGPSAHAFWAVGALGAFTTYSTFAAETFDLMRTDHPVLAVANVLLHVLVGAAALLAGRYLAA